MQEWVLLENRRDALTQVKAGLFFEDPVDEVICWHASQVVSSLQAVSEFQKQGYYVVGFISYEVGYILHAMDVTLDNLKIPLLHFAVYKVCHALNETQINMKLQEYCTQDASFQIENLQLNWSFSAYEKAFRAVKHYIREGDTYQVNLTTKYHFDFIGSAVHLYQQLRERQKVPYSGILSFSEYQLLTLSPELFFSKTGDKIIVKPMKGTIKRGENLLEDEQHKVNLMEDLKTIAENTMIVDLLRNDLSMISKAGSVNVTQLMDVESYETVHQMVSCIESQVDVDINFVELIRSLFPCGSITGAPKRRTMEIIRDTEASLRGIYTGTIGYIMPNNDMCFNVCIRTLLLHNGQGELGVGGGVVYDSTACSEFEELQLKGLFFTHLYANKQ